MDVNPPSFFPATIGDAPFRHREGLPALVAALGADMTRYVGGIVRDTLLGIDAADIDLATVHAPDDVIDRLAAARIRVVPTGIAHGTVTAVLPSGPIEVTTLRRDVATDGRHAIVAFTDDWREDAARRDFTMNALYADPVSGAVVDYFDGLADLAAGRVRFIGDPYTRIAEDHLRILRFFRFHARFGDRIDAAGLDACAARANDLMALSRERIAAELLKLLVAANAVPVVVTMIDGGILRAVLPEIDRAGVGRLATLAEREAAAGIVPDPIRRLASLLPTEAVAADVGARLKLSKAKRQRLEQDAAPIQDQAALELAYRQGIDIAVDRLLLSTRPLADTVAEIAVLMRWTPPRFPLSGRDIIARGITSGPAVARLLKEVERHWIAAGFPDTPTTAGLADRIVGQVSAKGGGGAIIA